MSIADNAPKVFGQLFRRLPSPTILKYYRLLWMVLYTAMFMFKDSLPEKYGRDAETLSRMVEAGTDDKGSYGAMAAIYSYLPDAILPFLPLMVCLPSLWVILRYVRSYQVMMMLPIVLLPYLLMNFLFPSKETLVAVIALAIYSLAKSRLKNWQVFMLIVVMYGVYAYFIREYYMIILAFFVAIYFGRKFPLPLVVAMVCLGLAILGLFVPSEIYQEIQGARDESAYAMTLLTNEVRTLFFNPLPPDSMPNFLVNMAFGLAVMFVPFIIAQSFNEVLMMVNVYFYVALVLGLLRYRRGAGQLPALLFIGHILTQAQFEPDLGSYVRHFSSVLVIMAPAIQYVFAPKPAMNDITGEANEAE